MEQAVRGLAAATGLDQEVRRRRTGEREEFVLGDRAAGVSAYARAVRASRAEAEPAAGNPAR
ncbi:hypothetical protein ACFWC6_33820 [Micromonospora chalcea]